MDEKYKNLLFKYTKLIEEIKSMKRDYHNDKSNTTEENLYGEITCDKLLEFICKLNKEYPSE